MCSALCGAARQNNVRFRIYFEPPPFTKPWFMTAPLTCDSRRDEFKAARSASVKTLIFKFQSPWSQHPFWYLNLICVTETELNEPANAIRHRRRGAVTWDTASTQMLVLHSHIVRLAHCYQEPELKGRPKPVTETRVKCKEAPKAERNDQINKRPIPRYCGFKRKRRRAEVGVGGWWLLWITWQPPGLVS